MDLGSVIEDLRCLELELARESRAAATRHPDRATRQALEAIGLQADARASSAEAWAREYHRRAPAAQKASAGRLNGDSTRIPGLIDLRRLTVQCDAAWADVAAAARTSGPLQLLDLVGTAQADLAQALSRLDVIGPGEDPSSRVDRLA